MPKSNKPSYLHFFFCPASDYLNQYNETGSHGQISYQFLKHLAKKTTVSTLFGAVIMSLDVEPIQKTKIVPLLKKEKNAALTDYDSLYFYIISYFKFVNSSYYRKAQVVHHIIPFAFGRSFNLFFLFRNKKKKYIIGPIIGPHINTQITADEEYVFVADKNLLIRLKEFLNKTSKSVLLGLFGQMLYQLSLRTLRNADIVFFSDNHAYNYHKKYLTKKQRGLVLDTGIDTSVFKPQIKEETKRKDNTLRVLFVGRLTKRKGCEYLIRALFEAKKINKDIKLHCDILGVGPLKDELAGLAKELGVEKNITFLGGVKSNEEIVHTYYKTDIVCLPALSETFTVTKEAMASGKPVIVTDVCSNAERVKPGINGYVVPPQDPQAIASVLVKLSDNPSLLTKLSANALKTRQLYDWNNILDSYLDYIS